MGVVSGKRSRDKGARGELRVRDVFRRHGFDCRRNFGSGSQGMGDLIGNDMPVVPEVKNTERVTLWPWVEQAQSGIRPPYREDEWCLHITGNNRPYVVVVDEAYFMRLLVDSRNVQRALLPEELR